MGIFRKDIEAIQQAQQNKADAKEQAEKKTADQEKIEELLDKGFYACTEQEREWLLRFYPKKWDEIRKAAFH